MKPKNGGTSTQENHQPNRPRSRFSQWRDERAVKRTVRRWHKSERKAARRGRFGDLLQRVPHAGVIGDVLYMFGFWLEYGAVCAGRTTVRAATAILSHVGALLFAIFRPLAAGLIVFLEDLLQPFVRLYSGVRHIRELPEQYPEESRKEIRAEKFRYFKRGTKRYLPLVWNVFTYLLPAGALVCLALVIQGQLSQTYRLEVRVNGETVGYVESEQVFDNARDDVQSRIASARAVMEASGVETTDAQWDITPTYTLAVSDQVMTESEVADAILRASSDEIGDGTAVYIDGNLSFVTTEGDHLRAYLDAIKAPYEDAFDANRRVEFVHDIRLVDGVYFLSSIVPYDTVISTLSAVTPAATYTVPEDGQTAAEAAESAGVSFVALRDLNPDLDLQTSADELAAGTVLETTAAVAEYLQVKVIERISVPEDVQYDTVETESDEYDLGERVVVQEGQLGLQEVVQDVTYINGVVTETNIVEILTVQEPVAEQVIVGTHVEESQVAQVGDGTWYWPVPDYRYVSRWDENGRAACDIIAYYGSTIVAADSGTVVEAGTHWSYGNYVRIDHGNGWTTLYAHMSAIAVVQGQSVTAGQAIGYVGQTGVATGDHCHFEMAYNGTLVSARTYFPDIRSTP